MNKKRFFFIAGLPRSGSTLLCNVLMQNSEIYASATSGLADVLVPIRNGWPNVTAISAMPGDEARQRIRDLMYGCLSGWYEFRPEKFVFDKSRAWTSYIPMLENIIGEKAKILVCVRDLPDVFSSLEKIWRTTGATMQISQEKLSPLDFVSVEARCKFWARSDQMIGASLNSIRDAVACDFADRLHFVEYGSFCQAPKAMLEGIYNFLEIEPFVSHDFENIEQVTWENDLAHGWVGLHDIRPKITYKPSDATTILGERLAKSLRGQEIW